MPDYTRSSREQIMERLIQEGVFSFAGFIQNEISATTLVLFKNVCRYFNIPYDDVNRITKEFADKLQEKEYTGWLHDAVNMFEFDWEDHWDRVESKMGFCYRYAGIPYNNGTAASGVIMADGEVSMPIRGATNVGQDAVQYDGTIMYNGVDLESLGYTKFDILTVSTLDMIQEFLGIDYVWEPEDHLEVGEVSVGMNDDMTLKDGSVVKASEVLRRLNGGEYVELDGLDHAVTMEDVTIVQGDRKVWETIGAGDTDFVFQFGSPGMKEIITKTHPQSIQSLSECVALYRPGPIKAGYIEKYIAIKNGQDPGFNEEDEVISIVLKSVFGQKHTGLMIFQEDLMRICQECAGFSLTEADDIRRGMSKKHEEVLLPWKERFVEGWNIHDFYHVEGVGNLLPDMEVRLADGGMIRAVDLYERLQSGESVQISDEYVTAQQEQV